MRSRCQRLTCFRRKTSVWYETGLSFRHYGASLVLAPAMSYTSTEHLCCFPFSVFIFVSRNLLHPTIHVLLTVFVSLIASERQKFVCAQDLYNIFMCRSTLHRWEPFNPKVIHACICIRKRGARRPRQDCSMLYMHTYFPPLVSFLTHALVFEQTEKKNYYRRRTREIWLIQRHYHGSIFHTFIFICSYLKPDFSFVSILTHFTLYYHTYDALLEVFIYQSTLDSESGRISKSPGSTTGIDILDWAFFVWVGCFNSDMWFL